MARDEDDFDDDNAGDEETGIEVKTSFFPLAWILLLCMPRIAIDDRVRKRPWGTWFFPVAPGRHRVEIWFVYLFMQRCGFNSRRVDVEPGEVAKVNFFMWPFLFISGSMNTGGGRRSPLTLNREGGTPMPKLWIILLAFAPMLVGFGIFFCCCGMSMLGSMSGAGGQR